MNLIKSQVIYFLMVMLLPLFSHGQQQIEATDDKVEILPTLPNTCSTPTPWSDNTYEELRAKLETILQEKNKSLISLDFKSLQAQVDVAMNHLMSQDNLTDEDFKSILKKNVAYLEQLETLLLKAQSQAKNIKEGYIVPLASLTSLKSEADKCNGIDSQYSDLFKSISQLNKDFNEILMISSHRISSQRERVAKILDQLEDKKIKVTAKIVTENFNYIQTQINAVTAPFEFDSKSIVAKK